MLKKTGVQVISINEPFDNSPTGRLMEAIIESLDEFYSDNLGEDVTRGIRESAERSFYFSSSLSRGYRKVKVQDGAKERTKLEPDPTRVNIVTSMFKAIKDGQADTMIRNHGIKGWNAWLHYRPILIYESGAQMGPKFRGVGSCEFSFRNILFVFVG